MKQDLYQIADELRALANAGLRWAENGYDKERYQHILKASARMVAALENGSEEDIYHQYHHNLAHLSPVLCVEAVVFRQEKILLIQRSDDRTWAVPGGLHEVGESPAEAAERELWEEAGLRGKAVRLLALYDSRFWPARTRIQLCTAQFLIESEGEPSLHPVTDNGHSSTAETLNLGFFAEDALPELHTGHDQRLRMAFQQMRNGKAPTFFDR